MFYVYILFFRSKKLSDYIILAPVLVVNSISFNGITDSKYIWESKAITTRSREYPIYLTTLINLRGLRVYLETHILNSLELSLNFRINIFSSNVTIVYSMH